MNKLLIVFLFLFLVMLIIPKIESFINESNLNNINSLFNLSNLQNINNMTDLQMNRDSLNNIENRIQSIINKNI